MGAVTYTISSNDVTMPDSYGVLSISVVREVNRISYAELVLIDGDYAKQEYAISNGNFFNPGKTIAITMRIEGEPDAQQVIFEGLVISQSLKQDEGNSLLTIEMSDAAIKLTGTKHTKVFTQTKDSDVITKIVDKYVTMWAGRGTIDSTLTTHEQLVQYHTTDWDMLISRADANGLLVTTVDGVISARKIPELNGTAKKAFDMGIDAIYDLEMNLDTRDQYAVVEATAWDAATHTFIKKNALNFDLQQGQLKQNADVRKIVSGETGEQLLATVPLLPAEAESWANAKMKRSRLAMLRGSFKIDGISDLKLLDRISLKGMGKKFDGNTIVTGIRHEVSDGNWFTHLQFGLSPNGLSETGGINALPASGLLPGISGLQIGIVEKIEMNAKDKALVLVRMPGATDDSKTVWARMSSPDAGNARGVFFWPEKDDEVLLGFINDDPRFPVILGSLYGTKNLAPPLRDDKNAKKGFASKKGMQLIFDDEEHQLQILTSAGNRIVVNETKKFIEIKDNNENTVMLNSDGIALHTAKSVTIEAGENVIIKGSVVSIEGNEIDFK